MLLIARQRYLGGVILIINFDDDHVDLDGVGDGSDFECQATVMIINLLVLEPIKKDSLIIVNNKVFNIIITINIIIIVFVIIIVILIIICHLAPKCSLGILLSTSLFCISPPVPRRSVSSVQSP